MSVNEASNDIELFTTDELVDEMLKRSTFCGILIRCKEELKVQGSGQGSDQYRVDWRNLDLDVVILNLRKTIEEIEKRQRESPG